VAAGFWSRATIAVALTLYAWSMMGIELYIRAARLPEGPDRALALFRREVMGRGVVGLGAAAVLAALLLAWLGRERRVPALIALALGAGYLACLWAIWPI
jgi:uncharacterized protein (TIGR03382 family)